MPPTLPSAVGSDRPERSRTDEPSAGFVFLKAIARIASALGVLIVAVGVGLGILLIAGGQGSNGLALIITLAS